MDYEKAYKEALKRAKKYLEEEKFTEMAYVFPELQESEDERIANEIIDFINNDSIMILGSGDFDRWTAWLEKQKKDSFPEIKDDGGVPGKDFIPVEWVDACEKYGKWKIVKQEQPELDIDTIRDWSMRFSPDIRQEIKATAYHFWDKALNARKEE